MSREERLKGKFEGCPFHGANYEECIGHSGQAPCSLKPEIDASDLMSVIHRDGGQYEAKHGSEKAMQDAISEIHRMRTTVELAERFAKAKGRFHSQQAMCDLMEHLGLACVRPTSGN